MAAGPPCCKLCSPGVALRASRQCHWQVDWALQPAPEGPSGSPGGLTGPLGPPPPGKAKKRQPTAGGQQCQVSCSRGADCPPRRSFGTSADVNVFVPDADGRLVTLQSRSLIVVLLAQLKTRGVWHVECVLFIVVAALSALWWGVTPPHPPP